MKNPLRFRFVERIRELAKSGVSQDPQSADSWERDIELALHGVSQTESPRGMESRILAALERAAPRQPARGGVRSAWGYSGMCAGLAACAVVAALLVGRFHHDRPISQIASRASAPSWMGQTRPTYALPQSVAARRPSIAQHSEAPAVEAKEVSVPRNGSALSSASGPSSAGAADSADERALAEFHAPSKPLPLQPLTVGERALLRVGPQPASTELADLNPEVRAAIDAREASEFQRFFAALNPPAISEAPEREEGASMELTSGTTSTHINPKGETYEQ